MAKINSNFNLNAPFNNFNNNKNNILKYNIYENRISRENPQAADESIINIPNNESFSICQRCKQKESVFSCLVCESFKFLCTKCDNYLHSLPSKQAHQRFAIVSSNKKTLENVNKNNSRILNKIEDNIYCNNKNNKNNTSQNNNLNHLNTNNSFDLNYKFNLSPINRLNTLNKEKDFTGENNALLDKNINNAGANNNNFNQNLNSKGENNNNLNNNLISYGSVDNSDTDINGNSNLNNTGGIRNNSMYNQQAFNSYKIPNAQSFSREYVYEIKTIFEKERSELIYKINSLQMTIERLKVNFTEQINYLHNQLEDVNKRSSYTIKEIQENAENRIKQFSEEGNSQYEEYKAKLEELESINVDLAKKLEENLKNICEIKSATSFKQSELEMKIRKKEEESEKQKAYYENKIAEIRKYLEDDKIKLMESYDKNINLLIAEFDQTKEKLNKLLKERETDLRDLIEKHKMEVDKLNGINKELTCEIDCHKMNIVNIRKRSEENKDEFDFLREENDSMKRELRFQISELKMLDGQNQSLLKENVKLPVFIV